MRRTISTLARIHHELEVERVYEPDPVRVRKAVELLMKAGAGKSSAVRPRHTKARR